MAAPLLFLIAILTPVALTVTLLVPAYAGILGACYIIYAKGPGPHPLADKLDDVFYIVTELFPNVVDYWLAHVTTASLVHYTLPLIGLPLIGFFLSYWLTRRLIRALRDLFHLTTGI